jgi:hypothetical protein
MSHDDQVKELVSAIEAFSGANGVELVRRFELASKPLLVWQGHLQKYCLTDVADELLEASVASVREAAALLAIGAVRPCIFSLRAQIDLLLGWIYFKDHKIEYDLVNRTGDGFKLKRDVIRYFSESFELFGEKFSILTQIKTRKESDPYRLLSAHIHAQSLHVVPSVGSLKDVVYSNDAALGCVELQSDVSEFLSDIIFSTGLVSYASLPGEIQSALMARKPNLAQKKILFA